MPDLDGKTILQIIPALETGGAERTAVDMTRGIVEAGGHAIVASAGGALVSQVEANGGKHVTLPLDAKFRVDLHVSNKRALIRLCQNEGVDLIHARSRAPAFPALGAARKLELPFLTTYHGIYSEKNALKRWYNSVMVAGDAVIANSAYTASVVKQRYQLPDEKLHIVHRGTDMALFDSAKISATAQAELRQKWHLSNDKPIVMLMARLTDWKGHLLAVRAAKAIRKAGHEVPHFVFAGRAQSETYLARVRSAIVEAALMDNFTLSGHVDDVALALSVCDLSITPSIKPEAFGRSVAEASAAGIPVIAFDHGGATETILSLPQCQEDQQTGIKVPVGDIDALAQAISSVLKMSKKERKAMGDRGRAHIKEHFTKERMIEKTLVIYSDLIGG